MEVSNVATGDPSGPLPRKSKGSRRERLTACRNVRQAPSLGDVVEQAAHEVHSAPLPAAAIEHALDCGFKPQMRIRNHQPHASQATHFKQAQELAP